MKPLLITAGDPAGIGPEVALKALAAGAAGERPIVLVGDPDLWARAAALVGVSVVAVPDLDAAVTGAWPVWCPPDGRFTALPDPADPADARLAARGRAQTAAILAAGRACLDRRAAAMVTMPIDKRAARAAGVPFPGHTELIADLCGIARPVMMLFGDTLRVVPITIHVPYAQVPRLLTFDLVLHTLRIAHRDLGRYFGLAAPRLALTGLNPHAGESGLFGREEIDVLAPAVAAARHEGLNVVGPLPADSAFAVRDRFDAILCPTHDQALIPLKQLHFADGVNATLGLPIVRTSPDHGTARDLAWQNRADPRSAAAAVRAAAAFVARLENKRDIHG